MDLDYKKLDYDAIEKWCIENRETAWLKAKVAENMEVKVYPKVTNAQGKKVEDKTKPPVIKVRPISFIKVKNDFCAKFMPELLPQPKAKKLSMRERAAKL